MENNEINIRLVRTQSDFFGMNVNNAGEIQLHQDESYKHFRNSAHFAVNGVVGDHAYGTFDGQIAVVCDPREMTIPSGFKQEDVWFHYNEERNINLGKAKVFAPMGIKAPDGIDVVYFDGSIPNERNRVINEYLKSLEIEPKKIEMWSWAGETASTSNQWVEKTITQLYGDQGGKIQTNSHTYSLDGKLDEAIRTVQISARKAQEQYLFTTNSGEEMEYTSHVKKMIENTKEALINFKEKAPESVVLAATRYLDKVERKIKEVEEINENSEKKFLSPYYIQKPEYGVGGPFSYKEVEEKIKNGQISALDQIKDIRKGDDFEAITNRFDIKATFAMPPPLPSMQMPPPLPSMQIKPLLSLPIDNDVLKAHAVSSMLKIREEVNKNDIANISKNNL